MNGPKHANKNIAFFFGHVCSLSTLVNRSFGFDVAFWVARVITVGAGHMQVLDSEELACVLCPKWPQLLGFKVAHLQFSAGAR